MGSGMSLQNENELEDKIFDETIDPIVDPIYVPVNNRSQFSS